MKNLITDKLYRAGLRKEHAKDVADVLVHADLRGVHSHGAMRVEYYAERIAKGGINKDPHFYFEKTGPNTALFDGDNGAGHVAAKQAMNKAIHMATENGIAFVGVKRISHSGALSYFVQQAAKAELIGISVCQSDPMVVPYGGSEPYYGTNPIAFPHLAMMRISLLLIWQRLSKHGEKFCMLGRKTNLFQIHGLSMKKGSRQLIRLKFMHYYRLQDQKDMD